MKDNDLISEPFQEDDELVQDELRQLEIDAIEGEGIRQISGSFAIAKIDEVTETHFRVELKWGVKSDCADWSYTERYLIDRFVPSRISDDIPPKKQQCFTAEEQVRLKAQARLQKERDQDLTGQDEEVFQGE